MRPTDGSILSFTPADPDQWEVVFSGLQDGSEAWTEPVIGFAVQVRNVFYETRQGKDHGDFDTAVVPVVIFEGAPSTALDVCDTRGGLFWDLRPRTPIPLIGQASGDQP